MKNLAAVIFILAFYNIGDSICEWTVVGSNKYNIKDSFATTSFYPYLESKEFCAFLGADLFEPSDEDTRNKVVSKTNDVVDMSLLSANIKYAGLTFWVNAVRTTDGVKYVNSGTEVDQNAWTDMTDNDENDEAVCIQSDMNGAYFAVDCASNAHPLCQMPVKWENIDDNFYMIEDTVSQPTRTQEEAVEFCQSLGDNVSLFEPKSISTLTTLSTRLQVVVWANIKRNPNDSKFYYASDGSAVISSFWDTNEPNGENTGEDCVIVKPSGKWNDVPCNYIRNFLCQKPGLTISPDCTNHGQDFLDDFSSIAMKDKTIMTKAYNYFCELTDEKKQEFIFCPQVTVEAENYFTLANSVGCVQKDDFDDYIYGDTVCDFVCQGIKAQAFKNIKSSEESSIAYYTEKETSYLDTIDKYNTAATIFTKLSEAFAGYKEAKYSNNPELVQKQFTDQIAASDLDDTQKEKLTNKVKTTLEGKTVFESATTYNTIETELKTEIVTAIDAGAAETTKKEDASKKKNALKEYYSATKTGFKSLTTVATLSKGSEALGHVATAVNTFIAADGDALKIVSGCLDLVNAISAFLPPPASIITQTISQIYNMFLGGGTTDTATTITTEIDKQTTVILDQFEKIKTFITNALDQQRMEDMNVLAKAVLADLSAKTIFIDSFRDVNMTGKSDLAREIKNEIQAFQQSTNIASFRMTYNSYCENLFEAYGTYSVETDLEERDKTCLHLVYTYVMIASTGKSLITSMANKLISSGADYLNELSDGYFEVQEFLLATDKTWLESILKDKEKLICAAFQYDSSMWSEKTDQQNTLMYIKAIDPSLQKHIEEYDCTDVHTNDNNVIAVESTEISENKLITTLKKWGKSFVVDFFLHYTVCKTPYPHRCGSSCYCHKTCDDRSEDRESYNDNFCSFAGGNKKRYFWKGTDNNILHIQNGNKTNGKEPVGYNFIKVDLDNANKLALYMPKKGKDKKYELDDILWSPKKGRLNAQEWHHITLSQLQVEGTSDNTEHKMSIRVDGQQLLTPETNNDKNYDNLYVYGSSTPSMGKPISYLTSLGEHMIYNLRFITENKEYWVKVGSFNYLVRVGPALLQDAFDLCNSKSMKLYTPSFESIHRLIYGHVSKYGATTFWTQAKYTFPNNDYTDFTNGKMEWMDTGETTIMSDWIFKHWQHTYQMYKRHGGCTIVGFNNRKNQISAVECNNEVADIVCQPL